MRWKQSLHEKKLDDLFKLFEKIEDEEIRSYLAKFLCVRTSGYIESSIKLFINEYIAGSSPKPIQKFITLKTKTITNLNYPKLILTLKSFNEQWAEDLSKKITDEQRAALNSVISNRNNIAHGENDVITYESMKNYYTNVKQIVNHLKEIIKK